MMPAEEEAPRRLPARTGNRGTSVPAYVPYEEPEQQEPIIEIEPSIVRATGEELDPIPAVTSAGRWDLPSLELLERVTTVEIGPVDLNERARVIEEALRSYNVDAKVVQINPGPVVTQFGVEPGWDIRTRDVRERDPDGHYRVDKDGNPLYHKEILSRTRVKVERITSLANDLALALAAPSIRIEAPVPGKPVVGIEVPNASASVVGLRDVIESSVFQKLRARSKIALALGKGAAGEAIAADLARMPHLLIAGATGSGKSVLINSIIVNILMHATPDEVRFLMVDPKRVELTGFDAIPHLLAPVVVDNDKALAALRWAAQEMDRRYRRFASAGARNLESYNRNLANLPLPYIVIIIDELADLMMSAPEEVERTLCRLAQLARATGIHLVVATQRPSVDVVTGLIKANFPTRISFAVTSQVDSRTILDTVGAEKLLGRGDMLYLPTDASRPKRLQGCYVSDNEITRLVEYWSDPRWQDLHPQTYADARDELEALVGDEGADDDPMLERARQLAEEYDSLSASMLQRRLRIGYPRAARILDVLIEEGLVDQDPGRNRNDYRRRRDDDID
jgi:S-DNA-T family DNA segregation ATPase FtsK/SpoIIIE